MTGGLDIAGAPMVQGVETVGPARGLVDALRRHWPEYLMEAAGLGLFMVSAGCSALVSSGVTQLSDDDPGFGKGLLGRDPDGHALLLVERPGVVR